MYMQPLSKEVSTGEMAYMREQGMTNAQIAKNLGCSEATVSKYLPTKRKSPAKLSETDKQEIAELYSSGSSVKEIAEAYGCIAPSIYRILKNLGIESQRGKRAKAATDQQQIQQTEEKEEPKSEPEQQAPIRLKKHSYDIYTGEFGTYTVDRTDQKITMPQTFERKINKEELREYIRELMDIYREV